MCFGSAWSRNGTAHVHRDHLRVYMSGTPWAPTGAEAVHAPKLVMELIGGMVCLPCRAIVLFYFGLLTEFDHSAERTVIIIDHNIIIIIIL